MGLAVEAGLQEVSNFACDNLDEWCLRQLLQAGARTGSSKMTNL